MATKEDFLKAVRNAYRAPTTTGSVELPQGGTTPVRVAQRGQKPVPFLPGSSEPLPELTPLQAAFSPKDTKLVTPGLAERNEYAKDVVDKRVGGSYQPLAYWPNGVLHGGKGRIMDERIMALLAELNRPITKK